MKQIFTLLTIFSFLSFSISGQTTPSCTPATTAMCVGIPEMSFYINTVSLNGSATVSSSPVCNGYSANTTAFSSSNLTAGQTYNITVHRTPSPFATPFKIAIWLDVNDDGDFEDGGEELFQGGGTSNTTYNGDITIPAGTNAGLKYLRLMILNNSSTTLTPCGTFSPAETEDYVIQIAGGGCTPTISSNSPVIAGSTISLTSSVADTYSWTGPNSFTSTQQSPTINTATLAESGTYSLTVTSGTCTATATTKVVVNLPPTLVAHYKLDGNANDASENNLNGTINGTVTATTDRFGNPNGAMSFNGNEDNYISVSSHLPFRSNNITLTAWVKLTDNSYQTFAGKAFGNCISNSYTIGYNTLNYMSFTWNSADCNDFQELQSSSSINTWVHIAQVLDDVNNLHKLYLNGVLVQTQPFTSSIIYDNSPFYLGKDLEFADTPNPMNGSLDDVRFYNYALTDAEIAAIYNLNCNASVNSNSPVCSGNQLTLSGSLASTYSWSGPNGFTSTDQNINIPATSATHAGIYTLTTTDGNGCTASATTNVIINNSPNLTAGSNSPISEGATLNLTVSDSNPSSGYSGTFSAASNQYVDVSQALPTDNYTIEMWIKTTQTDGGLFGNGAGPNGTIEGDKFIYIEGGILKVRVVPEAIIGLSSGVVVNDNTWHHIAVTQKTTSNEGTKIYVDGVFRAAYQNSTAGYNSTKFQIGTENNLAWQNSSYRTFYTGLIDNVKVWSVAKTANQIAQGMNEDSPVNTPNLVYYQKFENNINASVGTNGTTPNGITYTNTSFTTFAWTGPSGFSSALQNPTISPASSAAIGTYTVTATNANGCSSTATTNVAFTTTHLGDAHWTRTLGVPIEQNEGNATATDAAGNIYVTGYFSNQISLGSVTLKSAGNEDIFIVKYNSSGVVQWAKRAGGLENDGGTGIVIHGSSVYITGYIYGSANFNTPSSTGSNEITSTGYKDIFIAKYNDEGNFQWAKRAGGIYDDISRGIAVSGTSIYITGTFFGTANFNNPSTSGNNEVISAGRNDIFLAKFNDEGYLQWAKRAGGIDDDLGTGIAVNSNSVYITGSFNRTANFNTPSLYGSNELAAVDYYGDIFLAKFNDAGTFQWAKRAGGIGYDKGTGIAVNGNSIYITGNFISTANFNTPSANGSNEIISAGGFDIFLAKFNETGIFQWARRAGGQFYHDVSNGIAVNGSSVYIGGNFKYKANFNTPYLEGINEIIGSESNGETNDIFIAKYNDSGTFQWARKAIAGGYYGKSTNKSITTSNSNIYFTGSFQGSLTFSNSPGNNDTTFSTGQFGQSVFLSKYDDTGTLQWVNGAYFLNSGNIGRSTATDASGNIYVTGEFGGKITVESTTIYSAGGFDIFVAKYNNRGIFQWIKRAGGIGDDRGFGIAVSGSSVYITGHFEQTANFNTPSTTGSNEITSAGSTDILLAKFNDAGTFQWARRAGGSGGGISFEYYLGRIFVPRGNEHPSNFSERGSGIAVNGNNIYITGSFSGTANFNTPSASGINELTSIYDGEVNASRTDVFVAKYNDTGTLIWAKRAGGKYDDVANGIAVNGSSIYITGQMSGEVNFNTPSSSGTNELIINSRNVFLAKYDENGIYQWSRNAGGCGPNAGIQIAANANSVYITGVFGMEDEYTYFSAECVRGSISFGFPHKPDNYFLAEGYIATFLAKYDTNGTFQWARQEDGINNNGTVGYGITLNGSSVYISGGANTNQGNDIFISKYNDSGVAQWVKYAKNQENRGGSQYDGGYSVAVNNNTCYITGVFFLVIIIFHTVVVKKILHLGIMIYSSLPYLMAV